MAEPAHPTMLSVACDQAQLEGWELWVRYFALGGNAFPADLDRHIAGTQLLNDHEHDVLVLALNEKFQEMDLDHPIPFVRPDPAVST